MDKRSTESPGKGHQGAGKSARSMQKSGGKKSADLPPSFNLNFFREARLFLGEHRATLTFIADQEVASIHYDMQRDEIFYKGHNVKNLTLMESQFESLQRFTDYLAQAPQADPLRRSYLACLERVLPRQIK